MQIITLGIIGLLVTLQALDFDHLGGVGESSLLPVAASADASRDEATKRPSPEEIMNSRFPQPIKVGDLIGLPVLDYSDSTIGYVRNVVRRSDDKIQLIVTQGGWPAGWSTWRTRLVAVPIEVVAILGRQLNALEMTRDQFVAAPTWSEADGRAIPPGDTIRIAITRR